jgi:hypothetical protein
MVLKERKAAIQIPFAESKKLLLFIKAFPAYILSSTPENKDKTFHPLPAILLKISAFKNDLYRLGIFTQTYNWSFIL